MPQKSALNAAPASHTEEDSQTRVTAARSFYRNVLSSAKTQKVSVVRPEQGDKLHAKEHEACSRATD
jgi:hypothetical protein